RAAPRPGVGRPCLRRGAHGRRAHPAAAQGAARERPRPLDRNRARRGLHPARRLNRFVLSTLLAIGGFALLALVVGAVVGPAWGWASFSLSMLSLLWYHVRHFALLA